MWPWPLTFWHQNLTSSSLSKDAPMTKVWRKSINGYWRYRGNIVPIIIVSDARHGTDYSWFDHWLTHGQRHASKASKIINIITVIESLNHKIRQRKIVVIIQIQINITVDLGLGLGGFKPPPLKRRRSRPLQTRYIEYNHCSLGASRQLRHRVMTRWLD